MKNCINCSSKGRKRFKLNKLNNEPSAKDTRWTYWEINKRKSKVKIISGIYKTSKKCQYFNEGGKWIIKSWEHCPKNQLIQSTGN